MARIFGLLQSPPLKTFRPRKGTKLKVVLQINSTYLFSLRLKFFNFSVSKNFSNFSKIWLTPYIFEKFRHNLPYTGDFGIFHIASHGLLQSKRKRKSQATSQSAHKIIQNPRNTINMYLFVGQTNFILCSSLFAMTCSMYKHVYA